MTLAQDNLEAFAVCYQKAVDRLNKVRRLIYGRVHKRLTLIGRVDCGRTTISIRLYLLQSSNTLAAGQTVTVAPVLSTVRFVPSLKSHKAVARLICDSIWT